MNRTGLRRREDPVRRGTFAGDDMKMSIAETSKAGAGVDTTGGGHDGTLDADDKTIPLPRPSAQARPSTS